MDEKKEEIESKDEAEATPTKDAGVEEEQELSPLERADKQIAEMKALNQEKRDLLNEEQQMIAERKLEGRGEAGIPAAVPVKLTDTEYAEALQRGEVNPLKEDGLI